MHGFPRRLQAAAFLAVGLSITAMPASAAAATGPLRLLAPGDGAVLTAGSTAILEWTPLAEFAGPERSEGWEEWEAFLSLDGGATYPVRVTPHLDRELRRVTFQVPALPTGDARLLLRVGDERREVAFELPQRFTIATPSLPPGGTIDLPRTVWRRGEPARPGEPGVLVWVEGSRHGGPTREVVAEEPGRVVDGGIASPDEIPAPTAVTAASPPSGAPATDLGILSNLPPPRTGTPASSRAPRAAATDILLLIQRQNE